MPSRLLPQVVHTRLNTGAHGCAHPMHRLTNNGSWSPRQQPLASTVTASGRLLRGNVGAVLYSRNTDVECAFERVVGGGERFLAVVDDLGYPGVDSASPSEDLGRQPPQDLAAEQSALGGMLLSKDAIADVLARLRPGD